MPVDAEGQYYDPAQALPEYDLAPQLISTTGTSGAITVGDVEELRGVLGIHEYVKTALSGANNDLVWIARAAGASALTLAYVVAGNDTELTVTKSTSSIVVNVATDADGDPTSTANDILEAVNTDEDNSGIEVAAHVILAPTNTGVGVVTALSPTAFNGPAGSSPTFDLVLQSSVDDGSNWATVGAYTQKNAAGTDRKVFVGLGDLSRWSWTIGGTGSPEFAVSLAATGKGE